MSCSLSIWSCSPIPPKADSFPSSWILHPVRTRRGVYQTAKAGVGVGNLYNYYPSKDELFCAVLAPVVSVVNF